MRKDIDIVREGCNTNHLYVSGKDMWLSDAQLRLLSDTIQSFLKNILK